MARRLRCVSARTFFFPKWAMLGSKTDSRVVGRCRRPWTLGLNATTTAKVMTAIHDAVSPLTASGIKSSYQNEGDAFEEDWQEGITTILCFLILEENL